MNIYMRIGNFNAMFLKYIPNCNTHGTATLEIPFSESLTATTSKVILKALDNRT